MKKNPAVVLLSGGLDSATVLAYAVDQGYEAHCLSFEYGQRHAAELNAARKIAQHYQVANHLIIPLPVDVFSGSALTNHDLDLPVYDENRKTIPNTYVPARNTLFLSFALAYAESIGAQTIFIGASAVDYSGYPDCRPGFFQAFTQMANLGTQLGQTQGFTIATPLIHLSKAQTIELGLTLGLDYSLTISCYQADLQGKACGNCDSCGLRKKGFAQARVADPTLYI